MHKVHVASSDTIWLLVNTAGLAVCSLAYSELQMDVTEAQC